MQKSLIPLAGAVLLVALAGSLASGQAADPDKATKLHRAQPWSTVFAEAEVKLGWQIQAAEPIKAGRLVWNLATEEGLVLFRGETPVEGEAAEFAVTFPTVKPGVVLPLMLSAQLYRGDTRKPEAEYRAPLFVYPSDPFADRRETLKQLQIKLYDPPGQTAEALTAAEFPFERIHNVAAIGELQDGVLIVGEGTSFLEDRSLPELLVQAAARGVPVLCLTPQDGSLEIPRRSDESAAINTFMLDTSAFVRHLDKRLDDRWWMSTAVVPRRTLGLMGRGAQTSAVIEASDDGWQWLAMTFAQPKSATKHAGTNSTKLLVIALPLIEHWKSGPTPRFLFTRLIDDITPASNESKAKATPNP